MFLFAYRVTNRGIDKKRATQKPQSFSGIPLSSNAFLDSAKKSRYGASYPSPSSRNPTGRTAFKSKYLNLYPNSIFP